MAKSLRSDSGQPFFDGYAICNIYSTIPLIAKLLHNNIKQIWYADDASAGSDLQSILTFSLKMVLDMNTIPMLLNLGLL